MATPIGLFPFVTDYSMPVHELAMAAEARGFESIWVPEHTHIPASRRTPYPGGGELPLEYSHTLDPFVALAAVATVTKTIKLGTGICLLVERDTITTAKTVATLDQISNGRVLLGLGAGWNREEMENHGTAWASRFRKLEEQMQALRAIWAAEVSSFHGQFVNFDSIWSWPKPTQRLLPIQAAEATSATVAGVPLILGGDTDRTLQRIVQFGDGWLPIARDPVKVLDDLAKLRRYAEAAGRSMSSISVSVFAPPPKTVEQFLDTEADRVVLQIPPANADDTLRRLDRYAAFIR